MKNHKRKILLEDYISREPDTWGTYTWDIASQQSNFATGIDSSGNAEPSLLLNVFITQDMDDMGIATDMEYTSYDGKDLGNNFYSPLTEKLTGLGLSFSFMSSGPAALLPHDIYNLDTRYPDKVLSDYNEPGINLSAYTFQRFEEVKSYDLNNRYIPNFNMAANKTYTDYQGNSYSNVSKVLSNNNYSPINYILDGDNNETIDENNPLPQLGLFYKTYVGKNRAVSDNVFGTYLTNVTELYYKGQAFNETNTSLNALGKEEYLFGITSSPNVYSDVFIDRGRTTVYQSHMQLGEIGNVSELINYGNSYYKIVK